MFLILKRFFYRQSARRQKISRKNQLSCAREEKVLRHLFNFLKILLQRNLKLDSLCLPFDFDLKLNFLFFLERQFFSIRSPSVIYPLIPIHSHSHSPPLHLLLETIHSHSIRFALLSLFFLLIEIKKIFSVFFSRLLESFFNYHSFFFKFFCILYQFRQH